MPVIFLAAAAAAALLSALLIVVLRPLLVRYALARPNARSSHKVPTPQGGGIAVLAAALVAVGAAVVVSGEGAARWPELAVVAVSALVLAIVGTADDIRPLPVLPRLLLQVLAVAAALFAAGSDMRLLPEAVPLVVERAVLVLAGVWFVNLVNFMDGIDWMTVAEMVPVSAALALFALSGPLDIGAGLVAAGLLGGIIGFAPFNRPVARLFLGDVGSLPIGLLVGWMLYHLAVEGALVAALLLPLYYLADATLTLARRLARRQRVWQAHREHFYQRATDNGFSVRQVIAHVFALNVVLAGLAGAALLWRAPAAQVALLALGMVAVAVVLVRFSRPRGARVAAA